MEESGEGREGAGVEGVGFIEERSEGVEEALFERLLIGTLIEPEIDLHKDCSLLEEIVDSGTFGTIRRGAGNLPVPAVEHRG